MSEPVAVGRWRRLGIELRRLREERGLTGEALATRLKWSPSKVSRVERAKGHISVTDVHKFLVAIEAPVEVGKTVMALARECVEATKGGRSDAAGEDEQDAYKVREWAVVTFPRLLRTEEYARCVAANLGSVTPVLRSQIRAAVEETMQWQRRLTADEPVELEVVLDEALLYRNRGGPAVMREQLEHLLEVMTLPNVGVRMLPLGADALSGTSSFMHLSFSTLHGLELPDVVFIDRLLDRSRVDDEGDAYWFERVFNELWREAESESGSEEMIKRALSERWS